MKIKAKYVQATNSEHIFHIWRENETQKIKQNIEKWGHDYFRRKLATEILSRWAKMQNHAIICESLKKH